MRANIYFGHLIKQESLESLQGKTIPNTFVLEATDPFPGYFNNHYEAPYDAKPHYIYCVLDKPLKLEKFTRATQSVMQKFPHDFSAAIGSIEINKKILPTIRIRRLKSYDHIQQLQEAYESEHIKFKKRPSKNISENSVIHLNKFYSLSKVGEGLYLDTREKNIGYFVLPKHINWSTFVKITQQVRNNVDLLQFDASKGLFYEDYRATDIVRIYSDKITKEKLQQLQKAYYDRIK